MIGKKASWHAKKPAFCLDRMPASCRDRHASVSLHPEITGTDSRGAGASAPDGSPLETCLGVLRRSRRRANPPTLAVEPDHDQRLAEADVAQQAREHWPRAISAGGVFLVHGGATGGAKFVELRIGALFFGGHPRVADWRPEAAVVLPFALHHADHALLASHFTNQ